MSKDLELSNESAIHEKLRSLIPMAVGEWNENTALFFWENGTQSEFDFKKGEFNVNTYGFDAEGIRDNPSSMEKRIVAIIKDPRNKDKRYAFWGDGTWCDWSGASPSNSDYKDCVKEGWTNWPGNKVLVTALNWWDSKTYFFWSDNTYGEYNWESAKFDQVSLPQSEWAKNWPVNKKLICALRNAQYSNQTYLFWNDGTYNDYWKGTGKLDSSYKDVSNWKKWPVGEGIAFDSTLHEVEDVLINYNLDGEHFVIRADDKMQVPIHVWVKVRDKKSNQPVKIADRGKNNQNLITFYDYQTGAESGRGSYIPYVGESPGSSFSPRWMVGRYRNPIKTATNPPVSTNEDRMVNSAPDSPSTVADPVGYFDGWNRFAYYITTKEYGVVKQLAARVGEAGSYRYTGSDWSVEYAEIEGLKP